MGLTKMQMQGYVFDANQHEPRQGGGTNHPVGRFPATVSDTSINENKNKDGGFLEVEFTTPAGVAVMRYNLWNKNPQAVEIANGQLSALCRATGRFQVRGDDEGAALRGAQCMIEVGFQKGNEPSTEKPNGGYTEIKKVLDGAGNEPGKNPVPANTSAPLTQQAGGGWNSNPQPQQQPQQQPNQNPAQQNNGWQQGGGGQAAGATNPPWGSR